LSFHDVTFFDGYRSDQTIHLPWLTLELTCLGQGMMENVESALYKFSRFSEGTDLKIKAEVSLADEGSCSAFTEHYWEKAHFRYQFVKGIFEPQRALFFTKEGSLMILNQEDRTLLGFIHPKTPSAPYSTWPNLVSAPLAEYWHGHGYYPLHAAAIQLESDCLIFPGPSGSGKTTLCLALLRIGGIFRADDKVLIADQNHKIWAKSIQRTTNPHPKTIAHFDELNFAISKAPIDETNDKRPCLLEEVGRPVDFSSFCPSVICFPSVANSRTTRIKPLTKTEAFLSIAGQSPQSSYPERVAKQMECLSQLVRQAPAFELLAGEDILLEPESAAHRIMETIKTL
jgi:hypothetical protein